MIDQPWVVQEELVCKARRKEGLGRVVGASAWFRLCREVLPIQLKEVSINEIEDGLCSTARVPRKLNLETYEIEFLPVDRRQDINEHSSI